jgi:hypothetical protein
MQNKTQYFRPVFKTATVAVTLALASMANAADLPSLGEGADSPWQSDLTYENHTVHRQDAGLAKFRNTMQVEADKKGGDGWGIHAILRGSWDGVYQMNKSEYGKTAGGPIQLETLMGAATVPHGGGLGQPGPFAGLVASYPNNPNVGMRVLGDRWN